MSLTHRMTGTRIYRIWKSMRVRCNNPKHKSYKNYGGRGIKICPEWNDFQTFYEWSMLHGYEDNLTIDRIDVNGNYEPKNCRWITKYDQNLNRRNTVTLLYQGKNYTPTELSNVMGISVYTIYDAHKNQKITDFTNYKPRHSKFKNITDRGARFEVTIKGIYKGSYSTLEEALKARDKILCEG